MNAKRKFADTVRHLNAALCQPAVRMIVVDVWVDGDKTGHVIYPVVAIQSVVSRRFSKSYAENERPPMETGPESELFENGWGLDHQSVEAQALIVDEDYGLIHYKDDLIESDNSTRQLIYAPWLPEEDAERIKTTVERLESNLRLKMKRAKKT